MNHGIFAMLAGPHAGLMAQRGVTLEEYIGALGAYTPEQPLHAEAGDAALTSFVCRWGRRARGSTRRGTVCGRRPQTTAGGLVVTVWGTV